MPGNILITALILVDFFFKEEVNDQLNLQGNINPILVIKGKQCQTCIDELLRRVILKKDSIDILSDMKFVFVQETLEEHENNINFVGSDNPQTYIVSMNHISIELKEYQVPSVFLILTDNVGRIKYFLEYDVNYINVFIEKLTLLSGKYLRRELANQISKSQ